MMHPELSKYHVDHHIRKLQQEAISARLLHEHEKARQRPSLSEIFQLWWFPIRSWINNRQGVLSEPQGKGEAEQCCPSL